MAPVKYVTFILLCVFGSTALACDTYSLRRALERGQFVEIDNECSAYEARRLAETGGHRLHVNLVGFSGYEARRISEAGASFTIDNSFSSYEVRRACEALVEPAVGKVLAAGFSDYEIRRFSQAGCSVAGGDESDPDDMTYYEARRLLEDGGRLEIRNQFSDYETRRLAEVGGHRLTVHLEGFSAYSARRIAEAGASVHVGSTFSGYEARRICEALVEPAQGWVYASDFSDYEARRLSEAGCNVIQTDD